MIKKLGEYIASFSVIIIVLGFIKQVLYYTHFSVPIKYFLTLSEIGMMISDDLLLISTFLLLVFGFSFLMGSKQLTKEEENEYYRKLEENFKNLDPKSLQKIQKYNRILVLTFMLLFIAALYLIAFSPTYLGRLFGVALFILNFASAVLEFRKTAVRKLDTANLYFVFVLTVLLGLIIIKTGIEVDRAENGGFAGTKIITDDSTFISTRMNYFIGKTEKFLFIYNKPDSSCTIVSADEIKKIILKSK